MKPTVVVYPLDFFPVANKEQQKLLMALVEDIAKHCEISIKTVSIKDLWCQTAPACAAGKALETFLEGVSLSSSQIPNIKVLNRSVATRSSTTSTMPPMNFVSLTRSRIIGNPTSTRLLDGDGMAGRALIDSLFELNTDYNPKGSRQPDHSRATGRCNTADGCL